VPGEVTVGGAAAVLDNMQEILTADLSFYDIRSDQQRSVALETQKRLTLSTGEQIMVPLTTVPAAVTVYVRVSGEPEGQRVFDGVEVLWQLPPGFPYAPEFQTGEGKVSVTVTGPEGALKRIAAGDVHAFVDLTRLAREKTEPETVPFPAKEPVQVYLAAGFEALSARAVPASVTLVMRSPAH
jgi:YbbR domain-containing protein